MFVDDDLACGITPPVAPAGVVAVHVTCQADDAVTSNCLPGSVSDDRRYRYPHVDDGGSPATSVYGVRGANAPGHNS